MIAFDAYTGQADNSTTSQTFSHTCTGSERFLIVSIMTNNTTDILTAVTYNGVAMTLMGSQSSNSPTYRSYSYGLLNPASGANNVNITASSASLLWTNACSYTGVDTGQTLPDATAGAINTSDTVWSQAVTTVVDNCWHHTQVRGSTVLAATGNTVKRGEPAGANQSAAFDNNGDITPAGSDTNTGTNGASNSNGQTLSVSFAPSVGLTQDLNETLTIAASLQKDAAKAFAESTTITASVSTLLVLVKDIAESIAITITEAAKLTGRTLSEAVTVTESLVKGLVKAFAEAITITAAEDIDASKQINKTENIQIAEKFGALLNGIEAFWSDLYTDTADEWSNLYN